jgi:hypothetical protein
MRDAEITNALRGSDTLDAAMLPRALPPWIPSPTEVLGDGDASKRRWVLALTPTLFVLSWVVAFCARNAGQSRHGGIFFPLAAIVVCVSVVPLARRTRRDVSATVAQTAYLALASLTPWLVFGWFAATRIDVDGDSGGALGIAALMGSSYMLLGILPLTLRALLRLPVLGGRDWPVFASAAVITGLAFASTIFSAAHPTADALANYHGMSVTFELNADAGRYESPAGEGLTLLQRRVGARCVTRLVRIRSSASPVSGDLVHDCASPVKGYGPWWMASHRGGVFERSRYRELVFATTEGQVIGNKAAPRYLLFTAPLWEWIFAALVGVSLGLHTRFATRRTIAAWRGLRVRRATAHEGVARCDDGAVVQLTEALRGPVVLLGESELGAPFREGPPRSALVFAGGVEAWSRALSECESVATSFALAVMWLPAAPLLAAPLLGMLTPL